ncbi:nuclear transport factor 2 family protein [Sphingobium sp. Sx8-8]|uniref:nuclear transport factor 2 family protein n=1 Tax=Sphingobium sp. Sx8-8 TaxID=2933617 RepID=UPI001F5839FA|nr:nuclear transport factor 2 family protein [Sphingobium sp. Sx8-8]
MSDLERRIRRLEDRAALDDLNVRYFLACDNDDYAGIGDIFSPDACFAASGVQTASGRDAIVEFIRTSRGHMGLTVHTPHYALLTFTDEDRAEGLVGAHLELALGGQSLFGAVRYQDQYHRTAEGWRIASRDMRTIHIAPWSEVGQSLLSDAPVRWPGTAPMPSDYSRLR